MFATERRKSLTTLMTPFGSVFLSLAALVATSCSSGSKPALPATPANQGANVTASGLPPGGISPLDADTSLLQKSVARVLGFTDVGDIALTIYQDTESALFDNISAQRGTPDGSRPDPIFYHSPVFIAGRPKLLPLADGRINVTIPNGYTQQAVRELISQKMAATLAAYKINVDKIGLIPHVGKKLAVKIHAFGEVYSDESDAQIDDEFRNIIFNIHESKVPEAVIRAMSEKASDPSQDPGLIFLSYLSSINISYTYFVQQYGSSECKLNISDEDLRDLYVDQEGCPSEPSDAERNAGLEWVRANKPSAQQSVAAQLQTLLNESRVVTACAAAREARKLQAKASVSCTNGGTRQEDQDGSELSPIVRNILESSIKPQLESRVAGLNAATWDDDLMASVIKMFGSPEKYMSIVNGINAEVKNKTVEQLDKSYYDQTMNFIETIRNHDVFDQASQIKERTKRDAKAETEIGSTRGGSGGFNIGIPGIGGFGIGGSGPSGGGGSSEMSDRFKKKYDEFHNLARNVQNSKDVNKTEAIKAARDSLYSMGLDHDISTVNGEFKIIPRINLAVSAKVDRDEAFGQVARTTDLGKIVEESENFPVQLTDPADTELVVQIKCTANNNTVLTKQFPVTQFKWWQSSAFWDGVSEDVSKAVATSGCNFLGVRMFYLNLAASSNIPNNLFLTVYGLVEQKDTSGRVVSAQRSAPISVELGREHTRQNVIEGSVQIDAGDSVFSKVMISN